ncbi:MAG: FHA domain-containing protein [Hyphomicrobiaceae bacterium]
MGDKDDRGGADKQSGRFLGSLRDALAAASRDDTTRITGIDERTGPDAVKTVAAVEVDRTHVPSPDDVSAMGDVPITDVAILGGVAMAVEPPPLPSAAEAAKEARGGTPNIPPVDRHVEFDAPPTTRVVRQTTTSSGEQDMAADEPARTQMVRGRQSVERGDFRQDPVVGWLVIVGGSGIGAYRPVFEGNNTVGRGASNRVPIDFGDDTISSEEQAYIRYDSADRSFLFVPNLAKTNVVSVNDKRPSAAVPLQSMDVITMGRTQLVFVAFCGPEFDWGELSELKS